MLFRYSGRVGGVTGLEDMSHYPKITLALLKRGHSEADIERIWGGNKLRVMEAAALKGRGGNCRS